MNSLIIRPNKGRIALLFVFISIFACISTMLILLPDSNMSTLNRVLRTMVGGIGLLLVLAGYGILWMRAQKPIVQLDAHEVHYFRNGARIPWQDLREIEMVQEWGGQKVRWIYVYAHDPNKYTAFEKTNKKTGLIEADLIFDFSLAAQSDFEKVYAYIQQHINQGNNLSISSSS